MLAVFSSKRQTLISNSFLFLVEKDQLSLFVKQGLDVRSVEPIEVVVEIPPESSERQIKNAFSMTGLLSLVHIV